MLPEALLVCPREESALALEPVLEELGTRIERERDAIVALSRLQRHHYDALIVDCEGGGDEAEIVREVRETGLGRHTVTIAVIGETEDAEMAYALGAHFVLKKPLTRGRVERMLRAAHSLVQERRTYRRFSCEGPATIVSSARALECELLDLSAGGAAVQMGGRHELEQHVHLRFQLPGTRTTIRSQAELAWKNHFGRAGLRFTTMSDSDRAELSAWLELQARRPRLV